MCYATQRHNRCKYTSQKTKSVSRSIYYNLNICIYRQLGHVLACSLPNLKSCVHDVKGGEGIWGGRKKILLMPGTDVPASKVSHTLPNPFYQRESCQKYKSSDSTRERFYFPPPIPNSLEKFNRYSEFRRSIDVILRQCGRL